MEASTLQCGVPPPCGRQSSAWYVPGSLLPGCSSRPTTSPPTTTRRSPCSSPRLSEPGSRGSRPGAAGCTSVIGWFADELTRADRHRLPGPDRRGPGAVPPGPRALAGSRTARRRGAGDPGLEGGTPRAGRLLGVGGLAPPRALTGAVPGHLHARRARWTVWPSDADALVALQH